MSPLVGGVKVSWNAAAAPLASPVTSYVVRADKPGVEQQVPSGADWVIFPAAELGGVESFTVAAVSSAGSGPASPAVPAASGAAPLAGTVSFEGRIASWSGFPLSVGTLSPTLTFESDRGGAAVYARVQEDGSFSMPVPPGPGLLSYRDGTFETSAAITIPDAGLDQDLQLPDRVALPVRVVDGDGLPVEGAYVGVTGPDGYGPAASVPFEFFPGAVVLGHSFGGAPPTDAQGRTKVLLRQASSDNFLTDGSLVVPLQGADFGSQPCGELCPAAEQTLAQTSDALITGRLRTASGTPVPGMNVGVWSATEDGRQLRAWTQTEDDGSYAIPAVNGSGWLSLYSSDDDIYVPGFSAYGEIGVEGARTLNLTIPNPVTIRATLRDSDGPVAGGCVVIDEPDSPEEVGLGDLIPFEVAPGTTMTGIAVTPPVPTQVNGVAEVRTLPVARLGTLVTQFPDDDGLCTGPSFRKAPFDASQSGVLINKTTDLSQKRPLAIDVNLPADGGYAFITIADSQGDVTNAFPGSTGYVAPGVASLEVSANATSGSLALRYAFQWTKSSDTQVQSLSIATPPLAVETTIAATGTQLPFPQREVALAYGYGSLQECLDRQPVQGTFQPVPGVTAQACYAGSLYTGDTGVLSAPMAAASLGRLDVVGGWDAEGNPISAATLSGVATVPPAQDIRIPIVRSAAPSGVAVTRASTSGGAASLGVTWKPPASTGSGQWLGYEVGATPLSGQGATVLLPVDGTSAVLEGLTPWTDYRVTVTAVTGAGPSLPALGEASTDPVPFVPLEPVRAADTRNGTGGVPVGPVGADRVLEVPVAGVLGVPGDASAVSLNVTAVYPSGYGFVTVFPCGQQRPTASTLNFSAGTIANAAIAQPGTGGKVCLFVSAATQLIVDINGYASVWSDYAPLVPVRAADTRNGTGGVPVGPVAANKVLEVKVTGVLGVPEDARAVSLNVTAVQNATSGFVTVYPCGKDRPTASTLNFAAGTIANAAIAQPGTDGKVCLFVSQATQLIVDITGYFGALPPPRTGALRVVAITSGSLGLEWINPAGADLAAVILRRAAGGTPPATATSGTAVALAWPTAQSVVDKRLREGTTYAYSLFTQDSAGRTNPVPTTVIAATLDVTPPPAVADLRVTEVTDDSVTLAWTNPSDPDFALPVVRRQLGAVPPATVDAGDPVYLWPEGASEVTDGWLAPGTQYSYSVFTLDESGNASEPVSVTTTTL